MPDEDHRPINALLYAGESKPPVANILRVYAHLDAHRLPNNHRDTAPRQTLQRLIELLNFFVHK